MKLSSPAAGVLLVNRKGCDTSTYQRQFVIFIVRPSSFFYEHFIREANLETEQGLRQVGELSSISNCIVGFRVVHTVPHQVTGHASEPEALIVHVLITQPASIQGSLVS